MKTYKIGEIHKIDVVGNADGSYNVSFYELMGGRWTRLGAEERWQYFEDVAWNYGLSDY